ncbi:aldehyde dehydrogenase family protein [Streptomyces sp. NPDC101225]|uniref:aldehyde dehydrogenase family protein n=1 Tax=Streptomyces sp. NPDC101225 TaxID=3366135 RepID=UPI003828D0C4
MRELSPPAQHGGRGRAGPARRLGRPCRAASSRADPRGPLLVVGGHAPGEPRPFYQPTVITDVPDDAEIVREEIFGPVAAIIPFDTDDEAISAANDAEYRAERPGPRRGPCRALGGQTGSPRRTRTSSASGMTSA